MKAKGSLERISVRAGLPIQGIFRRIQMQLVYIGLAIYTLDVLQVSIRGGKRWSPCVFRTNAEVPNTRKNTNS